MSIEAQRIAREVARRRTFAIIAHPDAGKTTLTEKLLLYGGVIHLAGAVKAKRGRVGAVSDWMQIERERGISISTTILQFPYRDLQMNLLDTPGHADFSEDTYRTLHAVDGAVMLLDNAKGVESQTRKLFRVCRQRAVPIFTFVNKLDRPGRDPFELVGEVESVLGIGVFPVTWPVFHDGVFRGVYHRLDKQIHLFEAQRAGSSAAAGARRAEALVVGVESAADLAEHIGESGVAALRDEIELLDAAGDHFDPASFEAGELSPMFFGSAINNFGLQTFLDTFCDLMPPPRARSAEGVTVSAVAEEFSGFIFKIQANMNRAHRDRVAFIRICSGRYVRDMKVLHVATGREVRLANPAQFFAAERSAIDEAFAGDVIGVYDPGSFEIGDTLTAGSQFEFDRIPSFAPEHFSRMVLRDAMRRKQLVRGLDQLAKEGVIQLYRPPRNRAGDLIVGTVGQLQLEVTRYRLKDEYGAEIRFEPLRYQLARWVSSRASQPLDLDALGRATSGVIVHDVRDRIVVLFENEWNLRFATERLPDVEFAETAAGR